MNAGLVDSDLIYKDNVIPSSLRNEIKRWKHELIRQNLWIPLLGLHKPNFIFGTSLFFLNWAIILFLYVLGIAYPILLPFCFLIAGTRQRGLSNLIHDSSHWNLSRNKCLNDFITDLFAGVPMVSPVKNYRISHALHHRYLGHPIFDPDSKTHQRYEYNDQDPPYNRWMDNVLHLIFNFESWKDSSIGFWFQISSKQKIMCIIWWVFFIAIFYLSTSLENGFMFFCFWQLSRATGYHLIRTIAEFLDHSGLPVGSISQNTRIIKTSSWILKKLIHPHNDNFHALHHFLPSIPNYYLPKAHALIKGKSNYYNKIKINNGYFIGSKAAIKDLERVL